MLTQFELGEALGVKGRTFVGYFSEKRENNFWPLLPALLEAYPRVSRMYLYFGEGPVTIGLGTPLSQPVPPDAIAEAVAQMAREAKGTDRSLLEYVAGLPATASPSAPVQAKTLEDALRRILLLSEENDRLKAELANFGKKAPDEPGAQQEV